MPSFSLGCGAYLFRHTSSESDNWGKATIGARSDNWDNWVGQLVGQLGDNWGQAIFEPTSITLTVPVQFAPVQFALSINNRLKGTQYVSLDLDVFSPVKFDVFFGIIDA